MRNKVMTKKNKIYVKYMNKKTIMKIPKRNKRDILEGTIFKLCFKR